MVEEKGDELLSGGTVADHPQESKDHRPRQLSRELDWLSDVLSLGKSLIHVFSPLSFRTQDMAPVNPGPFL